MSDPGVPVQIIQIAVSSAAGQPDVLYGLAGDGTLWRLTVKLGHDTWVQLPMPMTATPQLEPIA